jgi:hypothetical protein
MAKVLKSFIQTKKALIAIGAKTKSWHSPWSIPMKEALFSLSYTYVNPHGDYINMANFLEFSNLC